MRYIDEFRQIKLAQKLSRNISRIMPEEEIRLMEVCGTHTQSFRRFGLNKLLPPNLKLIAGPGCPVCVTASEFIDQAIALAKIKNTIVITFGDMLRVPGGKSTLEKIKATSSDVRIAYSPLDALRVAKENPAKKVIFLAVGFETTIPAVAISIIEAKRQKINNLYFYSALKLIPPAMEYLVKDPQLNLQGFLCPGHVSAIIGSRPYAFLVKRYQVSCCITGFEPVDLLEGIYFLLKQIIRGQPKLMNQYRRVVTDAGNLRAQRMISRVFQRSDSLWRGLGRLSGSGLKIRKEFSRWDAEKNFSLKNKIATLSPKQKQCRCADILKGRISPKECPLFARICRPENPLGPCMVSSEGACNAYYKYR